MNATGTNSVEPAGAVGLCAFTPRQIARQTATLKIWEESPLDKGKVGYAALWASMLPHSDPGDVPAWSRRDGHRSVIIRPGARANPDGSITGVDRVDGVIEGETNQYYRDFARAMHEIGYKGYTSYELCHQLPVVNGETVGIEFAHKNAQLAAEFMREIIKAECGPKPASASVRQAGVLARPD